MKPYSHWTSCNYRRSNVNSVVRSYLSPTPVGVGVGTSLIWAVDQTLPSRANLATRDYDAGRYRFAASQLSVGITHLAVAAAANLLRRTVGTITMKQEFDFTDSQTAPTIWLQKFMERTPTT